MFSLIEVKRWQKSASPLYARENIWEPLIPESATNWSPGCFCLGIGRACKLHRPMYKSNADDQCGEVAQVDDGDVGDVDDEDDKDNDDKERAL